MASARADSTSLGSSGSSRRSVMSREQLSFETKQVVIDFLGLIPTTVTPSLNTSSGSSSSDEKRKRLRKTDSNASDNADGFDPNRSSDGHTWTRKLADLPEVSLVEKYGKLEEGGSVLTPQTSEDVPSHRLWHSQGASAEGSEQFNVSVAVDSDSGEETVDVIENGSDGLEVRPAGPPAARPNSIPLSSDAHGYGKEQESKRKVKHSPSPSQPRSQFSLTRDMLQRQGAVDRQMSNISETSDASQPHSEASSSLMASLRSGMSQRSCHVDIAQLDEVDIGTLVKNEKLPPLTLPLKLELDKEKESLNREFEEKRSSSSAGSSVPMTPQTEVAMMLGVIGDEVQAEYGARLAMATDAAFKTPDLSYDALDHISTELVDALPNGWKKAALLLLFGQKLAFSLISKGKALGSLVENITKVVENQTAEFIIQKGGWQSITALEDLSPVSPSEICPELRSGDNQFDYDELDMAGGGENQMPALATTTDPTATTNITDIISPQSQADSAISPDFSHGSPAHTSNSDTVTRDQSMDSISSVLFSGLPTPSDPTTLLQAHKEQLEAEAAAESQTAGTDELRADDTNANPEILVNGAPEGPLSPDMASVEQEIRLLRQISNRFPEESREESESSRRRSMTIGFTGAVAAVVLGYFVYKKFN